MFFWHCLVKILFILGIEGQDTFIWLQEQNLIPTKELLAWVHTHVQGTSCCFSSVDCHNQFALQKHYSPEVVGIVCELKPDKEDWSWDVYELSNLGENQIHECNLTSNVAGMLHDGCANDNYYQSCKENRIKLVGSEVEIHDHRFAMFTATNVSQGKTDSSLI